MKVKMTLGFFNVKFDPIFYEESLEAFNATRVNTIVQKQTTNLGVLLELGKTTLDLECIKLGRGMPGECQ